MAPVGNNAAAGALSDGGEYVVLFGPLDGDGLGHLFAHCHSEADAHDQAKTGSANNPHLAFLVYRVRGLGAWIQEGFFAPQVVPLVDEDSPPARPTL